MVRIQDNVILYIFWILLFFVILKAKNEISVSLINRNLSSRYFDYIRCFDQIYSSCFGITFFLKERALNYNNIYNKILRFTIHMVIIGFKPYGKGWNEPEFYNSK
jgi:hypothetical protein